MKPKVLASPNEWGSSAWNFLHCVASTYPEHPSREEQQQYLLFFQSLGPILPCRLCRPHYQSYLERFPIEEALESRCRLSDYLFKFHNHVNQRLGKPLYRKHDLKQYFGQKSKKMTK